MIYGRNIRTIFLPDVIGSYYLFSRRIAACEITQASVKIAVSKASGMMRTLENLLEVPFEKDIPTIQEQALRALNQALSSVGNYHELYCILPSSLVIFKELTLPFTSIEKIKLVLPFEVEPLLPFSLSDAVVDGIITDSHDNTSTIVAAAIKNELLAEQLAPFHANDTDPDRVTVDIVELYALYKAIFQGSAEENVLLMYMGLQTIRLAIVVHKQLKSTRFLPYGLAKLARLLSLDVDQLLHSTLSQEEVSILSSSSAPFFSDVQFTLSAFLERAPEYDKLQKIYLLGPAADVKGLPHLIEHATGLPCEILNGQAIIQHNVAKLKGNHGIPNKFIIPVAASLALPVSNDFNVYTASEIGAQDTLITQRLITIGAFMLLILSTIFISGFLKSRRLKQEIKASEKETVNRLKREVPGIAARVKSNALDVVKNAARNEVAREKNIWFALSNQSKSSFLMYLQELSRRIDIEGLGLDLARLTLTDETLTLEGRVKDYDALKQLEEDLRRSKMFTSVPRLQELTFTVKLPLDKHYGENQ